MIMLLEQFAMQRQFPLNKCYHIMFKNMEMLR
jgi:hypothetical protein